MKCKVLLILLFLGSVAQGQSTYFRFIDSTVSTSSTLNLQNSGSIFHQISWTVSGTVATCTVAVDSSADGISWSAGGIIPAKTCTSNGDSLPQTHVVANFARVNVTAISGAGAQVIVVYTGYTTAAAGGGTVTSVTGTPPITSSGGNAPAIGCATCAIGPGASTAGHVATFSGTDGLTLADGGAGGTGTVTHTGNLTANSVMLGNVVADSKVDTALVTDGAGAITDTTVGTVLTATQGTITTSHPLVTHTATWNAAGVAFTNWLSNITCTAAATASIAAGFGTAGTQWQFKYGAANCASPQFLSPDGATAAPAYSFSGITNSGLYRSGNNLILTAAGNDTFGITNTSQVGVRALGVYAWSSTTTPAGSLDTGISRSAAGVIAFGASAQGTTTSKLKASGYMSVGTKFTTDNGCTDSATAGGATAGTFTVGSTSCTEVITMGDSATAPNGWSCTVVDITTLADVTNPHQTTSSTTTATIVTGTVVSGDKIQFSCIGY